MTIEDRVLKGLTKGEVISVKIDDFSDMGQGIGHYEGMAVFVDGAYPGDVTDVKLTKVKKNYAIGYAEKITKTSDNRIDKMCEYNGRDGCGGCVFSQLSYKGQLEIKEKQVKDKLERIAKLDNPIVKPVVAMEEPFRYRNKAQMPIGMGEKVGFFKAKSHEMVDCADCKLQMEPAMACAEAVRKFMKETGVKAYDEKTGKGFLRHLIVKTAVKTGEVMAIIVAVKKDIPQLERLAELMDDAIYNIPRTDAGVEFFLESIAINVNKDKGPEILGKDTIIAFGKQTIQEELMDMKFEISPMAFYQTNPIQTEKLYSKVIEYACLQGEEVVLDLYCGVGTIGLILAREMEKKHVEKNGVLDYSKLGKVYGIESVKGAVLDANRNAVINGIVNARYLVGKAEDKISDLLEGKLSKDEEAQPIRPDVVILDPPRAGCDIELLKAVSKAAPEKIIYVSCDPGTMARDIRILTEGFGETKYDFVEATPVDMFPWTSHVESVCLLSKVQN